MEEVIKHFSHEHPLKLVAVQEVDRESKSYNRCYGCGFTFSTTMIMYGCSEEECYSKVYLCKLCAHLPEIIHNHPLHLPLHLPQGHHQLRLVDKTPYGTNSNNWCTVCGGKIPKFLLSYHCDKCPFDLHVQCAHSLRPTLRYGDHQHLLTLVHTNYTSFYTQWICTTCNSRLLNGAVFIRCVECYINYHIKCYESTNHVDGHIPQPDGTIKYQIEGHTHPLTLITTDEHWREQEHNFKYFFCDACQKWDWPQRWVYKCMECNNFTSHLYCPDHFPRHPYNFSFYGDLGDDINNPQCQECKKPVPKGSPAYGCKDDKCNLFLDDSCLQQWQALDKQIHPFHPQHPLKLIFSHGTKLPCSCCSRECSGFIFSCQDFYCQFFLDFECVGLAPSLQHKDHTDHLLVLLDRRASYPKTSYLRCVECRSDFSFTNCLLPFTIQHKCHYRPLSLVPRLAENDDMGQCYCDICEDRRDPSECIYYCGECKFEAHIGCVKLEILNKLQVQDAKFVTLKEMEEEVKQEAEKNKKEGRAVFQLKDVLLPLSEVEVEEIKKVLKLASNLTWESSLGKIPSYDDKITNKILYSDEPFKIFVNKLNSVLALEETHDRVLSSLEIEYKVVQVGEYLVPLNFEQILEALFAKHGDFGAGCTLRPRIKQYLFLGFCKVLQSLCITKIAHVTDDLLIHWWIYSAIGQAAGFEVQFAFEALKRIAYAHFGLEADKYADGLITRARTEIKQLPQEIEELARKLAEKRERLEAVRLEEKKLTKAAYRDKKSHLMRKCLIEAEDLVCYSGGELLFPPKD